MKNNDKKAYCYKCIHFNRRYTTDSYCTAPELGIIKDYISGDKEIRK